MQKMGESSRAEVVQRVENLVKEQEQAIDSDRGFTSLSQQSEPSGLVARPIVTNSQEEMINFPDGPEGRIRPPGSNPARRTQPEDIIGFSAVRASGFSRVGESRIFFENTVTDSGYGWDRSLSLFICHKAGLYFFTFSVKADADQGDNYKYEVSLVKNGEEVVSVGGAVDPSHKNSGNSASSSIVLQLTKEDRVWLQLVRGNLVETKNARTGYTAFSGYRLGCSGEMPSQQLEAVIIEEEEEQRPDDTPLENENGQAQDSVDRTGWYRPEPSRNGDLDRKRYPGQSQVYNDDRLYDAFDYNRRKNNENQRPNNDQRRPNNENRRPNNNEQDNFDRENEKGSSSVYDRRPENGDRRNWDKYSGSNYNLNRFPAEEKPRDTDRYEEDKYHKRYPTDRYTSDRHTFNIYDADRTSNRFSDASYGSNSDRVWGERNRHPSRRPDEGAMFFLKREQVDTDSPKDSVTHHSYGK